MRTVLVILAALNVALLATKVQRERRAGRAWALDASLYALWTFYMVWWAVDLN